MFKQTLYVFLLVIIPLIKSEFTGEIQRSGDSTYTNGTTVIYGVTEAVKCYADQYGFPHCYNLQSDKCVCRYDEFVYCCGEQSYCTCCPYWFDPSMHDCTKSCSILQMYKKEWSEFAKKYVQNQINASKKE